MQTSVYNIDLENEIHFDPVDFFNYQPRSDPSLWIRNQRASLRVSDTFLVRGGTAYTRAVFREGPNTGNDVPLVSRDTGQWRRDLEHLGEVPRGRRDRARLGRPHHGQRPGQPAEPIPGDATVDFKLSGDYQHFYWSVSANDLLNALYYDYAIASAFTTGRFSAYPLPSRTYMVKAGATF